MSLLEAVHRVNVSHAAALLFRGADVNNTDAAGVTPLIIACERGVCCVQFRGYIAGPDIHALLDRVLAREILTEVKQPICLRI